MEDLHPLLNHITRFVELDPSEVELIRSSVAMKKVKNKEHLLVENQVCDEKYFICQGILRKYINTEKGTQQIIQFSIENWWMTDYMSLESGKPSTCNIQAIEDCVLVALTKSQMDELCTKIPMLERYFRKILQRAFEASLTRLHFVFSFSGEERYHRFNSAFPDFVQRIPQYMLASYLGFTPEFLSKIRAKRTLS